MNFIETGKLLSWIKVADGRFPATRDEAETAAQIGVWQELLADLPAADCMTAARDYYRAGRYVITPSDVYEGVRAMQRVRLADAGPVDYPNGLTLVQEKEYRLGWQEAVRSGATAKQASTRMDTVLGYVRGDEIPAPPAVRELISGWTNAHTAR